MSALQTRSQDADLSLAGRDPDLPCLAAVLDDGRLSELMGEDVRITRVRYKPHTSVLVAFVRTRDGSEDHGWAVTRAADPGAKLAGRAADSAQNGGGIRFLHPEPLNRDAFIAVGSAADDWALRKNLRWLAQRGLGRLGAVPRPGELLDGTAQVLRYNPERRLVLLEPAPGAAIVIKTAAQPINESAERWLHERLQAQRVPVLPWLGDAHCSRRGTRASPAWGNGDLAGGGTPLSARHAGNALAALHGITGPESGAGAGPGAVRGAPRGEAPDQLAATLGMVAALVPDLEAPAARVAARLRRRLEDVTAGVAPVLIHGDFSPDQVLVSGADVRLIDFDRARYGAAESDLGSFAAVEEIRRWQADPGPGPVTDDLLEGYSDAGGRFDPAAVTVWAAWRLFCNSVDPFRDRAADWAEAIGRHLDRAAELVR
ncbi:MULTISPECIES: phosphotransferase family protein [Arthrobacter]|uniref:Aminoglycoside phosphotransferase family protein n=1 Tax=Arthrobacter oryzae TaxID=409290 RepID=A0A3N0C9T0_9MICC|nr:MULTISPECIES: phosphotransferase [Arthrobacter]QYF89117.1 aminoglycoside phosphotransferase family protein [Arthrobacter sp. PAMC25284]RNL60228.1 aminoglycoside phosphotransferase family protein [Arthrobacter oryzae]